MYRVLIADDELRDRNIIKILLERRYAGQFQFHCHIHRLRSHQILGMPWRNTMSETLYRDSWN